VKLLAPGVLWVALLLSAAAAMASSKASRRAPPADSGRGSPSDVHFFAKSSDEVTALDAFTNVNDRAAFHGASIR